MNTLPGGSPITRSLASHVRARGNRRHLRRGISRHVSFVISGGMGRYARALPTALCRRDIGALLRGR